VADRKRRGDDAVDERLDEDALAVEEDLLDETDLDETDLDETDLDETELDDEELLDEDDEEPARGRRNGKSGTTTKPRTAAAGKKAGPPGRRGAKSKDLDRPGIFGRIINFIREVVAELRKVIWPTRKELLTYTSVVIVFVTIMFLIVAGFDYAFAKAALWVFGGGPKK
jgi:preprotein translocase subunit SecE